MSGKLVILSGPSGVGKDTVIDAWRQADPRVTRVVAYTTRPPRLGEVDGVDYHFVCVSDFLAKVSAGDFLEFKEVFGNHYATPLRDMEALLAKGKIAVLKIDVQGALTVMPLRPDAITVFLLPPSDDELARRISVRGKDSEEQIQRRLATARAEIALADRYQHRIVNGSVEQVVGTLATIVQQKVPL